jgi:hypothetical protein
MSVDARIDSVARAGRDEDSRVTVTAKDDQ